MAFWYLFNFIKKIVDNINNTLRYKFTIKIIGKKFIKKKLYLIILTKFKFDILIIFNIRVIIKLDNIIH